MLRKGAGLSQEEFGARLNVSRQAVTKWESGEGLPDIGNLLVLSRMFKVSIDDLLSEEKALAEKLFLYESRVACDIESIRDFDIHLGCSAEVSVRGNEGEKLEVICSSNDIADLSGLVKIKVDDEGKSADVDLKPGGAPCGDLSPAVLCPQGGSIGPHRTLLGPALGV